MTAKLSRICRLAFAVAIAATSAAAPAAAGDLLLFHGPPPNAEDLADIMFPEAGGDAPPVRTRAIKFTDVPEVLPVPEAPPPVETAVTPEPEPVPEVAVVPEVVPAAEPEAVPEVVPVAEPEAVPVIEAAAADAEAPPVGDAVGFNITFGFDSATIEPESLAYLDRMGEMLNLAQAAGRRVIIVGHTDAKGSEAYNLGLSERRAQSVRNYLVLQYKIDPSRLWPLGLGESQPLPGVAPEDGTNRRVEFHPAS